MDFNKAAANAQRLIRKNGRPIQLYKLSSTPVDVNKPWRGPGAPTDTDVVLEFGVFAIGNTAIPTESRGLAFDWVDNELLRVTRHVCLVPALGLPVLEDYKTIVDLNNGNTRWNIIWGQCLQPADQRIL
jgi:hypothetical protein